MLYLSLLGCIFFYLGSAQYYLYFIYFSLLFFLSSIFSKLFKYYFELNSCFTLHFAAKNQDLLAQEHVLFYSRVVSLQNRCGKFACSNQDSSCNPLGHAAFTLLLSAVFTVVLVLFNLTKVGSA